MKRAIAFVCVLMLCGCGIKQAYEFKDWNEGALAMAESGDLKWSDYYKDRYDRLAKLPQGLPGLGFSMLLTNTLLDASLAYESGKISKEEFDSLRRKSKAEYTMYLERSQAEQQALYNQWIAAQAQVQQAYKQAKPVNCSSYKVGQTLQTNCY